MQIRGAALPQAYQERIQKQFQNSLQHICLLQFTAILTPCVNLANQKPSGAAKTCLVPIITARFPHLRIKSYLAKCKPIF
jgi:hypothetical protein